MRARLAKLAARSAQLSQASLQKKASMLGRVGKWAANNPLTAGMTALTGVAGAQGVKSNFKKYRAGFDPQKQRALLGQPPNAPGVA